MGIKISELASATSLTGAEELPVVQGDTTKRTTISSVRELETYSYSIAGAGASATNKSANSWQQYGSDKQTDTLPTGVYLMTTEYSYQSTNNSAVLTLSTTIDSDQTRKARSTGTLLGTAYLSCVGIYYATFSTETAHTIKIEGYGTAVWKEGGTITVTFTKIGEYIPTRDVEQLRGSISNDEDGEIQGDPLEQQIEEKESGENESSSR